MASATTAANTVAVKAEVAEELPEVLCAGLACVDMELLSCAVPATVEAITKYGGVRYTAGGCAPQAARALAALGLRAAAAYPAADDAHGRTLRELLEKDGVQAFPVKVEGQPTALAVLPVFSDGRRGCFVSLGANEAITASALVPDSLLHNGLRAFHVGYPHLLPKVQGVALGELLRRVSKTLPSTAISLDVNGANADESTTNVLTAALRYVDLLHANLEEACTISGKASPLTAGALGRDEIEGIMQWMCQRSTESERPYESSSVFITCGKDGVFAGHLANRLGQSNLLIIHREAFALTDGTEVNSIGAGDAFAAGTIIGFLHGKVQKVREDELSTLADAGLLSARALLDSTYRKAMRDDAGPEAFLRSAESAPRLASRFRQQLQQ